MTDWDASIDDADTGKSAFIALLCLVVRAACLPFDLFARLGQSADGDGGDQGADWGLEVPHDDGCNAA